MLKILTLNMHSMVDIKDLSKTWQQRFEEIVTRLLQEKFDIIAFQEVNQTIGERILTEVELKESGYYSANNGQVIRIDNFAYQLSKALKSKGLNYHWNYNMAHVGYDKYEEGTALFSLRDVRAARAFVSSDESLKKHWRYRVQTGMKIHGDKEFFWCISVHFSWWKPTDFKIDNFVTEWEIFERKLKGLSDSKIIAIGDFNNPPQIHNQGYDYLTKERMWNDLVLSEDGKQIPGFFSVVDAIDGWESESASGRKLDYVLCNKKIKMKDIKLIFNGKNGGIVSDHFGVSGIIDL